MCWKQTCSPSLFLLQWHIWCHVPSHPHCGGNSHPARYVQLFCFLTIWFVLINNPKNLDCYSCSNFSVFHVFSLLCEWRFVPKREQPTFLASFDFSSRLCAMRWTSRIPCSPSFACFGCCAALKIDPFIKKLIASAAHIHSAYDLFFSSLSLYSAHSYPQSQSLHSRHPWTLREHRA